MNASFARTRTVLRKYQNRLPNVLKKQRLSTGPVAPKRNNAMYNQSVDAFPSIVIGPDKTIVPQGPFAEAQAQVCLR